MYKSFSDGRLLQKMDINGPYVILRVYLDAFCVNNPIGSASNKHKILGCYYTPFHDLRVSAIRSTVQTLCLLYPKDVEKFGLDVCLQPVMKDLSKLVQNGLFDRRTNSILQVRVIANIGDNLGT